MRLRQNKNKKSQSDHTPAIILLFRSVNRQIIVSHSINYLSVFVKARFSRIQDAGYMWQVRKLQYVIILIFVQLTERMNKYLLFPKL